MKSFWSSLLVGVGLCCWTITVRAEQAAGLTATATGTVLGPYLQALSPDAVVVQWRTEQPAYGWVEYGETKALGLKQDAVADGLRVANVKHHRVVLGRLRPGVTYWYRVCVKPIRSFGAYRVDFEPEQKSELVSFQTLPGPREPLTAVVFNDLHNNLATFQGLSQVVQQVPFSFSIFNGDCLADPEKETKVLESLAAFNQGARTSARPAFFVRGNHETRGAFARELRELLVWPSDKPYFAFSAGAVRFLVLDCGEDKADDHREYSGLVDFESFRRTETEWLKDELGSKAFRKATWRVLVCHIPLYPTTKQGGNSKPCQELWAPLLAKARVDLALDAHLHRASFHPAQTVGNPFPFVIGGGSRTNEGTVMILEADSRQLKLRVLNANGKEVLPVFQKRK